VRKLDHVVESLPLPRVNPNLISGLSILLSLVFILIQNQLAAVFVLLLVLVLDYLDGAVARKYNTQSEEGYVVDVASDRMSEGIIFSLFFFPWFFLFSLNCLLSLLSVKKNIHIIIPLRHIFLVFIVVTMLI